MIPQDQTSAEASDDVGPQSLASQVYGMLRASVIFGEIPPQTHINIDATARRLGASQTPVREALQRLEGDGLVLSVPNRGYTTTATLTTAGLRDLFEFRLLIEPWAARKAATDPLTNPADAAARELEKFELASSTGEDVTQAMLQHDAAFHLHILQAAGNATVCTAYEQTHCHLHLFRLYRPGIDAAVTLQEHREIWQALKESDAEAAAQSMIDHIRNSFQRYIQAYPGAHDDLRLETPPRLDT